MHHTGNLSAYFVDLDCGGYSCLMEYRTIKTESTSSRLEYVDVAKAIGIIAVMMSHGVGFPYNTGYYFTASYMALFFFLSGYTYKDSKTVKDNIVRRLSKIGKAYFL